MKTTDLLFQLHTGTAPPHRLFRANIQDVLSVRLIFESTIHHPDFSSKPTLETLKRLFEKLMNEHPSVEKWLRERGDTANNLIWTVFMVKS